MVLFLAMIGALLVTAALCRHISRNSKYTLREEEKRRLAEYEQRKREEEKRRNRRLREKWHEESIQADRRIAERELCESGCEEPYPGFGAAARREEPKAETDDDGDYYDDYYDYDNGSDSGGSSGGFFREVWNRTMEDIDFWEDWGGF